MKNKIVVANFKMNLVLKFEIENWLKNFSKFKNDLINCQTTIVLSPPILNSLQFVEYFKDISSINVGLQDAFWERKGSFTGGVSASTFKSYGGQWVILGHSERKKYFGETEIMVAKKIINTAKVGLNSIICIGETAEEKRKDATEQSLLRQLEIYFQDFPSGLLDKIAVCYEPVWAISSNDPLDLPTADEIMMIKLFIKKFFVKKYGAKVGDNLNILYGGSVNRHNVREITYEAGIDGVLVGKASLIPAELFGLIKQVEDK